MRVFFVYFDTGQSIILKLSLFCELDILYVDALSQDDLNENVSRWEDQRILITQSYCKASMDLTGTIDTNPKDKTRDGTQKNYSCSLLITSCKKSKSIQLSSPFQFLRNVQAIC